MISFDRKAGNVNLTPLWNEINSIKSDTSSIWNFVSTITGIDIASSIMSSISDITDSLSSISSEIISLNSDTSSIVSDTAGLNMDVVSLYNFSSVMTSSIADIVSSLSTITGGGSGGPYYLAYSDAVASSLHYVYNMTGDIPTLPYNSIKFYGSLGTFNGCTIPMSINKFSIGELDLISNISYSMSATSIRSLVNFSMNATVISAITLNSLREGEFKALTFTNNHISNIDYMRLNANFVRTNTFEACCGIINCIELQSNFISNHWGIIQAYDSIVNNTIRNCISLQARMVQKNSFYSNYIPIINCGNFSQNTYISNFITPNIYCDEFLYNSIQIKNNNTINAMSRLVSNTFYGSDTSGSSSSERNLDIYCGTFVSNVIHHLNKVVLSCNLITGEVAFRDINELHFDQIYTWLSTYTHRGNTTTASNSISNIKLIDAHKLNNVIDACFETVLGIETMRLNYDWNWGFVSAWNLQNIQPTNIYTLDFYNCDDYIGGSTFTIPSFYSGYDEGNVWISGKPLNELGYTLSVSN